jgi:hypothetical protein
MNTRPNHCRRQLLANAATAVSRVVAYPVEIDGTTFDLMERFGGLNGTNCGRARAFALAAAG